MENPNKITIKGVTIEDNSISPYGKDIEDKLISALSEELARGIDREILRTMGIEPDRNKRRKNSIGKIFT